MPASASTNFLTPALTSVIEEPIEFDSSTTTVIGPPQRLRASTNDGAPCTLLAAISARTVPPAVMLIWLMPPPAPALSPPPLIDTIDAVGVLARRLARRPRGQRVAGGVGGQRLADDDHPVGAGARHRVDREHGMPRRWRRPVRTGRRRAGRAGRAARRTTHTSSRSRRGADDARELVRRCRRRRARSDTRRWSSVGVAAAGSVDHDSSSTFEPALRSMPSQLRRRTASRQGSCRPCRPTRGRPGSTCRSSARCAATLSAPSVLSCWRRVTMMALESTVMIMPDHDDRDQQLGRVMPCVAPCAAGHGVLVGLRHRISPLGSSDGLAIGACERNRHSLDEQVGGGGARAGGTRAGRPDPGAGGRGS